MSVEERIAVLVGGFSGRLSVEITEECKSLAQHGEWGVALENFCVQLYEYDIIPSVDELAEIQRLATEMELNDDVWSFLVPPTPSSV